MPRGRPRGSRNATSRRLAIPAAKDASLLSSIETLVARNRELADENARLRALVDAIAKSVKSETPGAGASRTVAHRRRPGRPRKVAAVPKRTRKKITDPVVLEKRREALAKARAVRAERLAQAKS